MDCLFCKISKGEIPSYTVYEDNKIKVFLDIHPHVNGHMLIIPKNHYTDINDIDNDIMLYIYKEIAPKLYKIVEEKLDATGFSLGQNNGTAQDIKHYHVHFIPKYNNEYKLVDVEEIYKKLKG